MALAALQGRKSHVLWIHTEPYCMGAARRPSPPSTHRGLRGCSTHGIAGPAVWNSGGSQGITLMPRHPFKGTSAPGGEAGPRQGDLNGGALSSRPMQGGVYAAPSVALHHPPLSRPGPGLWVLVTTHSRLTKLTNPEHQSCGQLPCDLEPGQLMYQNSCVRPLFRR